MQENIHSFVLKGNPSLDLFPSGTGRTLRYPDCSEHLPVYDVFLCHIPGHHLRRLRFDSGDPQHPRSDCHVPRVFFDCYVHWSRCNPVVNSFITLPLCRTRYTYKYITLLFIAMYTREKVECQIIVALYVSFMLISFYLFQL